MPVDPPATALAVVEATLALKVLGPTASYLGEAAKTWTEARVTNVRNIFDSAFKKLSDDRRETGSVPPRVLKAIMDDGSYCDDALITEYYGGVLASSKSGISRDDRGATFSSLIGRLSAYQVRAHYVLYMILKIIFKGEKINPGLPDGRNKMATFIPLDVFITSMDFQPDETDNLPSLLSHIIVGLVKENLIDSNYQFGEMEHLKKVYPAADQGGIIFGPSVYGLELFYWSQAQSELEPVDFLDTDTKFQPISGVSMTPTLCRRVR